MTGISGAEFVAWALPITVGLVVSAIVIMNHYKGKLEHWGMKHIYKKK
ncbi:hypothetical protein [Pseudoalteromonas nigrifaciens]